METARRDSIDFFLGATTPAGFKGYFWNRCATNPVCRCT